MNFGDPLVMWTALMALANALMAVILGLTLGFAARQIREAARARRLESARPIFENISSTDLRAARRLITGKYEEINRKVDEDPSWVELDAFLQKLSDDVVDFNCLHTYLASLENVSMLVMHDMAPDDLVQAYLGRMAPRHWERLGPFITFMRRRYGSDDFLQHFEMLTKLIKKDALRLQFGLRPAFPKWAWRALTNYSGRTKRKLLRERMLERQRQDARWEAAATLRRTEPPVP